MVEYVKLKDIDEDQKETQKPIAKNKSRYKISFKKILLLSLFILLLSMLISSISLSLSDKIAVVPIKGVIMSEKTSTIYSSSVSSREIASTLYDLRNDDSVKAILLDINSPGGSPVASDEISKAIENIKKVKPIYSLINDVGASGAYWVASSTDKIYSSSMSTIGSIGVTSAGLSFENFITEHNITYRQQISGKYKDMGSIYRKQTDEEKAIIQNLLDNIHKRFIEHVAKNRNITIENVTKLATGEIFLGSETIKNGLTDKIGYYPDVINKLKNITNSENAIVVTYGSTPTLLQIIGIESLFNFKPTTKSQILLE